MKHTLDLIIYMKKLLNSNWLRALQFNCNTTAKSVTPVHIVILGYDWLSDNREFSISKTMVLHKMMTKICVGALSHASAGSVTLVT